MSKYDPMTGELISEDTEETVETNAAENTVTPETNAEVNPVVSETNIPQDDVIVGYDPMTGEPIRQSQQMGAAPVMQFDPMTGKPVKEKKSRNKLLMVIGAVAVVVILVLVALKSGLFMSKSNKVLVAMANTFADRSRLMENVDSLSILASDSYTVAFETEVEGDAVSVQYSTKSSEKQVSGSISAEDIPEIEFIAGITSSEVKLQVPDFSDRVFVYNYKEENDGYLADYFGDDVIEAINTACENIYSPKKQKAIGEDVAKIIMEEYDSLEFESVGKEEFEVDGKDRDCKGYQTTITADSFLDVLDDMEDVVAEEYGDILEELEEMDVDVSELFDEMRYAFEDMPDMDVTFYIYKNKIACISMEVDREEVQLLFKGGDKGMPNIELNYEGDALMELKGSVKGSEELYELEIEGEEMGSLEYDYKSGDFVLEMDDYGEIITIEGNLKSSSKGMTFVVEEYDYYGDDISCTVSIEKGASMQKFDGDEFDVGNASESDFEEIAMDMYDALDY